MAHAQVGAGSAYAYTVHDEQRRSARRRAGPTGCTSTPDPPAKNFWAVDVYDTQTRSLLAGAVDDLAGARPATPAPLQANDDGSYDLYFGPTAPQGKESNWVETIPGKSWFQLFRLYGPLEPWFDQTWKLNEFEPV